MKIAVLSLITALFLALPASPEKIVPILKEGEAAPVFMLPSLDGERVSLRDYCGQLRNPWKTKVKKIVILSFMASYCVPCKHEIPQLEAYAKEAPEDVKVVFISVDTISNELIQDFADKMGMKQTVLSDRYGNVMKKYGVQKLPSLFVLDREGNLFFQSLNGLPPDMDLKDALKKKVEAVRQAERGTVKPSARSMVEIPKEKKIAALQGLIGGKPASEVCRELALTPEEMETLRTEANTILREAWGSNP